MNPLPVEIIMSTIFFQFRKHLYYKHESEHTVCKDCHQKTWQHVYHFCIQVPVLQNFFASSVTLLKKLTCPWQA